MQSVWLHILPAMQVDTLKTQPNKCNYCDNAFSEEVTLKRHLKNTQRAVWRSIWIHTVESETIATNALWVKPCRKPEIKKNTPRLPFFGDSYISDRNIWNQFHFCLIFGYELKAISAAVEFSQESVGIPAGLLKDVKEWGDQFNRFLNKRQQIFLMIKLRKKYLGNICTEKGCPEKFVVF